MAYREGAGAHPGRYYVIWKEYSDAVEDEFAIRDYA